MKNELRELGESAFKRYSQNLTKLHALELDEKIVEYFKIKDKLDEDATVIKEAAKESLEPMENKQIKVTIARAWKKWYDVGTLKKKASTKEWDEIEANCLVQDVDKVKFEELVEENKISTELKQASFKEEEMTPRVSIKEKND